MFFYAIHTFLLVGGTGSQVPSVALFALLIPALQCRCNGGLDPKIYASSGAWVKRLCLFLLGLYVVFVLVNLGHYFFGDEVFKYVARDSVSLKKLLNSHFSRSFVWVPLDLMLVHTFILKPRPSMNPIGRDGFQGFLSASRGSGKLPYHHKWPIAYCLRYRRYGRNPHAYDLSYGLGPNEWNRVNPCLGSLRLCNCGRCGAFFSRRSRSK